MNSLAKTARLTWAALVILFLGSVSFLYADAQILGTQSTLPVAHENLTLEETPTRPYPAEGDAKHTAIAAAAGLLKKTRVWKRVSRLKKRITEKYSFEFRKRISGAGDDSVTREDGNSGKNVKSGEIIFSGRMEADMTPVLSLTSGFRPGDVSVRFDVLDHELDCEISSRAIEGLAGGRTSMALSSDGGSSQAMVKLSFEF